ncbi:hypothetical protein [Kribbella sp. NBC_00889]|uniref:hypothetical protein n=1 Tax=Kribbella sp. NBC_00889 TaxID=2975974 RepID=UPI00386662B1|nr:hypothetical protein OG817_08635 [Kribbella sp. NBC_00889]
MVHSKLDFAVGGQPESLDVEISTAAHDCAVTDERGRRFVPDVTVEVAVVDSQQLDELVCDMLDHTLGV